MHDASLDLSAISHGDFATAGFEDDLRVDRLCRELLLRFYEQLLADGIPPAEATSLAGGADCFLRDFVVDRMRTSPLAGEPGLVRRFAGTWYIITSIEPDAGELCRHLDGVGEFFRFLHQNGLVADAYLEMAAAECADRQWYAGRIRSFLALSGDGYRAWERDCPIGSAG